MTTALEPIDRTSPPIMAVDPQTLSSLVLNGDLRGLNPQQKVQYYISFCQRLGLDPATQPFKILKLQGKEILYADRGCCQQLNKLHQVSHNITARETSNGCYVVTAVAYQSTGRQTTSIGAVPIDGLQGEPLCNAIMKAETKAKRRATLDLLGLGMLDETEADSIAGAQKFDFDPQNGTTHSGLIESGTRAKPQTSSVSVEDHEKEKLLQVIDDLCGDAAMPLTELEAYGRAHWQMRPGEVLSQLPAPRLKWIVEQWDTICPDVVLWLDTQGNPDDLEGVEAPKQSAEQIQKGAEAAMQKALTKLQDGQQRGEGVVEFVHVKSGKGPKGAWTKYGVKMTDGVWFNTFDATLGTTAKDLSGQPVQFIYKTGVRGNDLVAIEAQ